MMDIYVKNLPLTVEENDLMELFSSFSPLSIVIVKDTITRVSKGYGFVKLSTALDAQRAIDDLNGHLWCGKYLSLEEARPPRPKTVGSDFIPGNDSPVNQYQKTERTELDENGWAKVKFEKRIIEDFEDPDYGQIEKEISTDLIDQAKFNKEETEDGFVKVKFKKEE